ncbi:MAG: nucleoside triphosphate pyrophosphohydrolase [Rikenella sp.]|nr:nucleoside triphosphate pyrophosphohydrolase [Rikenella sp.]
MHTKEEKLSALGRLLDIMDELREKCPWDREQTMLSLRNATIEECFELMDAIVEGDPLYIKKELGDLLLHVVFYAKIAQEEGRFDIGDVATALSDKLVYRHPHVYGEAAAADAGAVMQNWEALKQREKDGNKTLLSGVPRGMPALPKACRIQQKVSTVGFDWPERSAVWAKVCEEIDEIQTEIARKDTDRLEAEFGDLLFSVVNAARLYGVNPDLALERTNRRFMSRFGYMEKRAAEQAIPLQELTPEQFDALWEQAKRHVEETKD